MFQHTHTHTHRSIPAHTHTRLTDAFLNTRTHTEKTPDLLPERQRERETEKTPDLLP